MSDNAIVCDLVLLSWNHLEQTQPCLETLFKSTTVPCRLFIVDNGSEPAVRQFLAQVKPQGQIKEVVLLQNEKNEGFPRGMNRGIQASSAPYVCLLNNDLRFAPGWLQEMIAVAEAHPEIGVVNPESNTFGHQLPAGLSLEAYGDQRRAYRGQFKEVGMCIGFCMLLTRALVARIGGLTEEVERIFFEDEDYCMRAQEAGFLCVVAQGAYVFHAEHQTVKKMPEREALFARNQRWCHTKWGKWMRIAWPHPASLQPGSPELRRWLTQLLQWARRRTHVYVYAPTPPGLTIEELFRSVGLVLHADIHWYAVPRAAAAWAAGTRILARRKKPFDIIVAPNRAWRTSMGWLRWCHGAAVVPAGDEQSLSEQWQQRRRLPS